MCFMLRTIQCCGGLPSVDEENSRWCFSLLFLVTRTGTGSKESTLSRVKFSAAKFLVPDRGYIVDCGIGLSYRPARLHTAKTKYRNVETNISRKGISGSQSQFPHSCVCERFIYSHDRSAYFAGGNM
jgi:hypothetical protein